MMSASRAVLLIIDIQDRLLPAMPQPDAIRTGATALISAARHCQVPIVVTEQYRKGLGPSDAAVLAALPPEAMIMEKMAFSALREPAIVHELDRLRQAGRDQIVLCGLEAHICVLQTALKAREAGFAVSCVADAVASRQGEDKALALARMGQRGIEIVSLEMVLYEWLERAGSAAFKDMLPLIKQMAASRH